MNLDNRVFLNRFSSLIFAFLVTFASVSLSILLAKGNADDIDKVCPKSFCDICDLLEDIVLILSLREISSVLALLIEVDWGVSSFITSDIKIFFGLL